VSLQAKTMLPGLLLRPSRQISECYDFSKGGGICKLIGIGLRSRPVDPYGGASSRSPSCAVTPVVLY